MAAFLIAHPFRLAGNGSVQKSLQGADDHNAQQLAIACLTRPGERILVPEFGVFDPTFDTFDPARLQTHVAVWGPDVILETVDPQDVGQSTLDVHIEFS